MPSTSKAQAKFMRAVAHSKEFAAKVGVPQSVGKEFNRADERRSRRASVEKAFKKVRTRSP